MPPRRIDSNKSPLGGLLVRVLGPRTSLLPRCGGSGTTAAAAAGDCRTEGSLPGSSIVVIRLRVG